MKKPTYLIVITAFAVLNLVFLTDPAAAQDPVDVDAKHYKVEFENEQVRVLRINYGGKERSVMHYHPAGVAIFTTGGNSKFTLADGKTEERKTRAGQVVWAPEGNHLPENLADKPFEVILVELKSGSFGGPMPAAADDPVKADAKHHKVMFENDRVRVLRGAVGPRSKTGMHAHPANVVVFLNDGRVRSVLADGKSEEAEAKAGQFVWRGPAKHLSENLSDRTIDVIVIELKGQ